MARKTTPQRLRQRWSLAQSGATNVPRRDRVEIQERAVPPCLSSLGLPFSCPHELDFHATLSLPCNAPMQSEAIASLNVLLAHFADTAGWRINVDDGRAHEVKKHTVAQHEQQLNETRAILGDKLSLYQIHSATEASSVLEAREVLEVLGKLRDQGVAVGASVSHPQAGPLRLATAATAGGAPLFASVQATRNLLDQSARPFPRGGGKGVFRYHQGGGCKRRLTWRNVGSEALALLEAEAAKLSTTVDALALAWILTQPFVGMVLSGASTCEQLRSNCMALQLVPLDPELHERLSKALRQDCEAYWQDRKALEVELLMGSCARFFRWRGRSFPCSHPCWSVVPMSNELGDPDERHQMCCTSTCFI